MELPRWTGPLRIHGTGYDDALSIIGTVGSLGAATFVAGSLVRRLLIAIAVWTVILFAAALMRRKANREASSER